MSDDEAFFDALEDIVDPQVGDSHMISNKSNGQEVAHLASVEVNMSLPDMESVQPRSDLLPHLPRFEGLVNDLKTFVTTTTDNRSSSSVTLHAVPREVHFATSTTQNVWKDSSLLTKILEFEGSLGYYHKYYHAIVGISSPEPQVRPDTWLRKMAGTPTLAFVNKTCYGLIRGPAGLQALQTIHRSKTHEMVQLAKRFKDDPRLVPNFPLARVCAMVTADDAEGLQSAFSNGLLESAFSKFLKEDGWDYETEDPIDPPPFLPDGHPLEKCNLGCSRPVEVYDLGSLVLGLAESAAQVGAFRVLELLSKRDPNLCVQWFDHKAGEKLLERLVEQACYEPCLEELTQSISVLMQHQIPEEQIQERQGGSLGNPLHLAATKGDYRLVEALPHSAGMDPSIPCAQYAYLNDERDQGRKELPLPEDWARARGHFQVAELLQQRRHRRRPDLSHWLAMHAPGGRIQTGKLIRFFPKRDRQYGFIKPERDNGRHDFDPHRSSEHIYVHSSALRKGTQLGEAGNGYPFPGQKVCFCVSRDRRGRKRAQCVISGEDKSYLRLASVTASEAEQMWQEYDMYGSKDEDGNSCYRESGVLFTPFDEWRQHMSDEY